MDALVGVATVYQNTVQFDKAREAYIRCAEVEPQNHLPYYAVGTLDWLLVHNWGSRFTADEKSKFLEEGMRYLDKAFALKPDYEDTLWYQNLLLREKVILLEDRIKATTDKPTQNSLRAEVEVLKARADERVSSALETRRKNGAKTVTPASRGRD
jgi:tetratricopeptide (TPR) repeat protein